jgi:hypothetical protein
MDTDTVMVMVMDMEHGHGQRYWARTRALDPVTGHELEPLLQWAWTRTSAWTWAPCVDMDSGHGHELRA